MGRRRADDDGNESALQDVIELLSAEVHTLRIAVDELREELVHELRQLRDHQQETPRRFRLTSMPLDPASPDFHRQVNALDASVFDAPESFEAFLQLLMSGEPAEKVTRDNWVEDQDFNLGEVIEIDSAIQDWYAEYIVVVRREADWFVADGGEGWFYFLWGRDGRLFLRLLTDEQEQQFTRWTGLKPEIDEEVVPHTTQQPTPPTTQATLSVQRSLW